MDKIAFLNVGMLIGERHSIYQPAQLTTQAGDVFRSLGRMQYERFFLADEEAPVHGQVREWLLYHGLLHRATYCSPEDNDPGTMERLLLRPRCVPPENHHLWRVVAVELLALAHQAHEVIVLDLDTQVAEKLAEYKALKDAPFAIAVYTQFSLFLQEHPLPVKVPRGKDSL